MNVDNNKRFQDTEDKILNAYGSLAAHKELSKITVSDICRLANIHRTTFYGHFEDVFAVQTKIEQRQLQIWSKGFFKNDGQWNMHEGILKLLMFYYNTQEIIRFHMRTDKNSYWNSEQYLFEMDDILRKKYMNRFNLKTESEYNYHFVFFNIGIFGIIRQWVERGCKESPEEMTDIICHIMEGMTMKQENESN